MDLLLLKLALTPALIAASSLAGRRWGHTVSGWLVGLPLTSAPVALFLALERGERFAASAALGSLAGAVAEAAFCVAYVWTARDAGWAASLAAATLAFALAGALLQWAPLGLVPITVTAAAALVVSLAAVRAKAAAPVPAPPPAWDLPLRMVLATGLVLAITESAAVLGPRLSGILATFPVYAAILTVFAHRADRTAAPQVLRGLLLGLFAFGAFFVVLALTIERLGVAAAFSLAGAAALLIQGGSYLAMRVE
ncbi:MAG TPA: hypothetical protein VEA38_24675 [Terriglobales bacterium]|nr:hypothetical protein [Terriglobales bacterium]